MDRGKRVMQPEADFDLNMEPLDREEECKKEKKARFCELEAGLVHVMVTSKKEKECTKELKKKLIEFIEENKMSIETDELEKNEDPDLLWESIIVLRELMNMDLEVSSSQSDFSDDKKN